MDEVVTPSANGFGSDDEDMMCVARLWVCACVCVLCDVSSRCGPQDFFTGVA